MEAQHLDRFLDAQDGVYETALLEIQNGEKESHWMWYIFPQLRGLGYSPMAYTYGIDGLEEAQAYLEHPVLSARLLEISNALLIHQGIPIEEILGGIDALKLRSCMTLFSLLSREDSVFHQVLDCFYDGKPDPLTLQLARP